MNAVFRHGAPEQAGMAAPLVDREARLAEGWVVGGHTSELVVVVTEGAPGLNAAWRADLFSNAVTAAVAD
jgi:hypothetical protein